MDTLIRAACVAGVGRLSAWTDLLDAINVFPVADGDTGRNLIITLASLRELEGGQPVDAIIRKLLLSARGNSGNIAAQFFSGLLTAQTMADIPAAAKLGRDRAWQAVHAPRQGTMLTVFDALAANLAAGAFTAERVPALIADLDLAVRSTTDLIPRLRQAGVVDSGALGMYIFYEGFFHALAGTRAAAGSVTAKFGDRLRIASSFTDEDAEDGFCVDLAVRMKDAGAGALDELASLGTSVVIIPEKDFVKVHLHTDDVAKVRERLATMGTLVRWSTDDLDSQTREFRRGETASTVHVMTDAAGSVTREDARTLGMTLLDSYIIAGDRSVPETHFAPDELYGLMRSGVKVSTSQASAFERHERYASVLERYGAVLYLCVGSVFTGNYQVAVEWGARNDPDGRLLVIDSGTASGRLGLAAIATARRAREGGTLADIAAFAGLALGRVEEYIFLDRLHYLAAGGRLSRTSAFFGELLHLKPVVSPHADGARKVAVVRNREEQVRFAMEKLASLPRESKPLVMLEYTDNRDWVEQTMAPMVREFLPHAEVLLQPLSFTTGVHTGPGTWAIAFLPATEAGH